MCTRVLLNCTGGSLSLFGMTPCNMTVDEFTLFSSSFSCFDINIDPLPPPSCASDNLIPPLVPPEKINKIVKEKTRHKISSWTGWQLIIFIIGLLIFIIALFFLVYVYQSEIQ